MGPDGKKLQTFDEDDIVRYSMGLDVPIVGLVRDRHEYREMREIALIYGTALALPKVKTPDAPAVDAPTSPDAPKPEPATGATGTVAAKARPLG